MILRLWHNTLDMPKHNKQWHKEDMADELAELHEAKGFVNRWSELSDVAYTYSRGEWSGHNLELPISLGNYAVGLVYMYPKYSLRYAFFRHAGKKLDSTARLKEVRNPKKTHKLHTIAEDYGLNKEQFQAVCEKQLKYWPLLP